MFHLRSAQPLHLLCAALLLPVGLSSCSDNADPQTATEPIAEDASDAPTLDQALPCIRKDHTEALPQLAGYEVTMEGARLLVTPSAPPNGKVVTAAVAADLRFTSSAAGPEVAWKKYDLGITLGGIAQDSDDLTAAFERFAPKAKLMIAMPGDRENQEQHRSALATLAGTTPAIDASNFPLIEFGGTLFVFVPGLSSTLHLISGASGCLRTEEDIAYLASAVNDFEGRVVLLSYPPPSPALGIGGISVFDPSLQPLLDTKKVNVAIHGMTETASSKGKAVLRPGATVTLQSGSLDLTEKPQFLELSLPVRNPSARRAKDRIQWTAISL